MVSFRSPEALQGDWYKGAFSFSGSNSQYITQGPQILVWDSPELPQPFPTASGGGPTCGNSPAAASGLRRRAAVRDHPRRQSRRAAAVAARRREDISSGVDPGPRQQVAPDARGRGFVRPPGHKHGLLLAQPGEGAIPVLRPLQLPGQFAFAVAQGRAGVDAGGLPEQHGRDPFQGPAAIRDRPGGEPDLQQPHAPDRRRPPVFPPAT